MDGSRIVFYESHDTTYSYTRIGTVTNPSNLPEAVGPQSALVAFE